MVKEKNKIALNRRWIKTVCLVFLISLTCIHAFADNNIPPLIKRPEGDGDGGKQNILIAEVIAIKTGNNVNNSGDNKTPSDTAFLEGNEALSFLVDKMGVKDYELVFQEKQEFSSDNMRELYYKIKEGLDYYVIPREVVSPGICTADTRVQITNGDKKIDAIKATAKAKLGEPLVYKGIQLDSEDYIIIFTLKNKDVDQSQGGEQNQEQKQEQEQKKEEQEQQNKEEQQDSSEQEKNDEENKNENRQMQLLLESLDDMDQKEQKEMLNERERIMLPEKWW